jgi:hypothetical protein
LINSAKRLLQQNRHEAAEAKVVSLRQLLGNDPSATLAVRCGQLPMLTGPRRPTPNQTFRDVHHSGEFNTGTAKHTFCKYCGIHPFYVPRSDPDKIDINVRCLDGIDVAAISPKPFDGRNWEAAMQSSLPWRQTD